jgi:cytochrome c
MSQKHSLWSAWSTLVLSFALLPVAPSAFAQSPAAQRGLTFVRVHCAQCHSIDKVSESPLAIAPPFRTFHQKFPIESLRRRLAEGIMTTHPSMPQFRLDADQISDVLAYLQTLQPWRQADESRATAAIQSRPENGDAVLRWINIGADVRSHHSAK